MTESKNALDDMIIVTPEALKRARTSNELTVRQQIMAEIIALAGEAGITGRNAAEIAGELHRRAYGDEGLVLEMLRGGHVALTTEGTLQ